MIEVLVAIVVVAIGVVGLMAALTTNALTTETNRSQAQAESALQSASEYVKGLSWTAAGCWPTAAVAIASSSSIVPHDPSINVTYGPAAAVDTSGTDPDPSCAHIEGVPVNVSGNGFSYSFTVVKRR